MTDQTTIAAPLAAASPSTGAALSPASVARYLAGAPPEMSQYAFFIGDWGSVGTPERQAIFTTLLGFLLYSGILSGLGQRGLVFSAAIAGLDLRTVLEGVDNEFGPSGLCSHQQGLIR